MYRYVDEELIMTIMTNSLSARFIISVIISLVTFISYGQTYEQFKFIIDRENIDSTPSLYMGMGLEYDYTRIINDGCITDIGVFGNEKSSSRLMYCHGEWRVGDGENWQLLCTNKQFYSPFIHIGVDVFMLIPVALECVYGLPCMRYQSVVQSSMSAPVISYWISPSDGVVRIKTDNADLVRSDILK